LLDATHRYGASKSRFFTAFGFRVEHWEQFAQALREHGQNHEVYQVSDSAFGPRFEVEGTLPAPDGRAPHVRTVWQLDKGKLAPRLITAYPIGQSEP